MVFDSDPCGTKQHHLATRKWRRMKKLGSRSWLKFGVFFSQSSPAAEKELCVTYLVGLLLLQFMVLFLMRFGGASASS